MGYFGVKYLVRVKAMGKPKGAKKAFKSTMDLLEDRVSIVKAKTADFAFKKAEREQKKYCDKSYVSLYGQKVVFEPIACFDCFSISADRIRFGIRKGDLSEVYSRTELIRRSESNDHVVNRLFGKKSGK
jgi:hypothetical protein